MASEVFRIEIPIEVQDKTDPGVSRATEKMNGFDKANQRTQERLKQMNRTKYQVALEAIDKASAVISRIRVSVKGIAGRAWSFTMSVVDKVTAPIKSVISTMGKLLGITGLVSTALAGISVNKSLQAYAENQRMLTQLRVSAGNMGIDESGINTIVRKAEAISKATMYSDDAMVGAAAELATYFDDVEAITRMMGTVADYAAGMSGGVEVSTMEMVDYATNLAKMTTGAFDAMTKKGFEVTDMQKKILDAGTDMEKVAVIEQIIKDNWDGMAAAMANTPTGQLAKMKNSWGDIAKNIGEKLTPAFTRFYGMLNSKMPAISNLIERVAEKGGAMFENFIPTIEGWIDTGIEKMGELADKVKEVTNSPAFKNANLFGKVKIAWDEIIAKPFTSWWNGSGKAWLTEKMTDIGRGIAPG